MSSFFDKSRVLIDSCDGLLCKIHFLKIQLTSDDRPAVLRQVEYQKIRSKLEKNFPMDSSDFMKVRLHTSYKLDIEMFNFIIDITLLLEMLLNFIEYHDRIDFHLNFYIFYLLYGRHYSPFRSCNALLFA